MTDLTHSKGSTSLADYDLSWDAAGGLTGFDFTSQAGLYGDTVYTYDATNQLTGADYVNDWQTNDEGYAYDDNGNRETPNGQTYATDANNRMTSDGAYAYGYDAEGNRTLRYVDVDSKPLLRIRVISRSESVHILWILLSVFLQEAFGFPA